MFRNEAQPCALPQAASYLPSEPLAYSSPYVGSSFGEPIRMKRPWASRRFCFEAWYFRIQFADSSRELSGTAAERRGPHLSLRSCVFSSSPPHFRHWTRCPSERPSSLVRTTFVLCMSVQSLRATAFIHWWSDREFAQLVRGPHSFHVMRSKHRVCGKGGVKAKPASRSSKSLFPGPAAAKKSARRLQVPI